ncbi:MAG: amidohydrolase family protein [Candidatus Cloacimonetes bacterium]|nr:amidohydrolase family protein [Candidatus Cloacimonadota bacterium]
MARKRTTIIKANVLFDGEKLHENKFITLYGNEIQSIDDSAPKHHVEGWVTPAFIDAHSHIGMDRDGEPFQEAEVNDYIDQITPLLNPIDSIYWDDRAFHDAVDFGVLYSCVIPGSGNLLGGKAMIIRNFAANRDEALVEHYGYKMALGYNPRSTTDWKGKRCNTRMGVYAQLEAKFDEALQKKAKADLKHEKAMYELERKLKKPKKVTRKEFAQEKAMLEREYELGFTPEERALLELLSGEKTAKVHVHKDDDVLYLIHLCKKYGLKVTAEHTCDVFHTKTFNALAKAGIPVVYGPLGTVGYKVELKHMLYTNAKLLMDSNADYGLMTDHSVIHTISLRESLKFFLIQGMSEAEALSIITKKNARILGIDDRLGSIEPGKLASVVVWDRNPLHLAAFPKMVIGEGAILRQK